MYRSMRCLAASVLSAGLMMIGLWLWQRGPALVLDLGTDRPEFAWWTLRSAAIAAISGAQAILAAIVLGQVFRRSRFDLFFGTAATLVSVVAAVAALVCGVIGR